MNQPTAEVVEALLRSRRPIICGHVVPDADCIGSMLALASAMKAAGGRPRVLLPTGHVSQRLAFLLELSDVERIEAFDGDLDAAIALDTAGRKRINGVDSLDALADAPPLVNVDHHATNERFGNVDWVVDSASSTCELVFELLQALDWPVTANVATLLFAGLHEDTLGFSLPNVSRRSLEVAGELSDAGAKVSELGDRLCRSQTVSEFRLMQTVYRNVQLSDGGRLAWSTVSHAELVESGCKPADIDNQVSVPRSLEGVQLAILFSEGKAGVVRINFRGKGEHTVVELAKRFSGGGHAHAAGAVIEGTLEKVVADVTAAARDFLR